MSSKVSTLTVSLKDDVSGKAGQIGKALKTASDQARAMAQAMNGTGASKGFVNNLSRLGLSAKDIEKVSASLKDYAKAAGLAGDASSWTKAQTAQIRQWETATVAALRHVAAEQKTLARGTRDMIAGMSASGRDMVHRARVAEGMNAPARAAIAARVKAEAEVRERAEAQIAARADARKTLAGMAGIALGHKVKEGTRATLHTYREFDKERRFGKAVMGLTDEEQRPLVDQALHMGATTKYNDVQVLEAQRELAARGLKKDQVLGMMDAASKLGMALDLSLPAAVKQMEGALFGFKKPIGTLDEALASARRTADLQVKVAKISGMTPEDISQAYKYAATPARMAGLSEEMMLTFAAISKKANMGGDEAGVAFRALGANLLSPTRQAREVMLANGMDPKNYQRNPDRIDTQAFAKTVAAQYGVKLDKGVQAGLEQIFTNKSMIADPSKFTPAVMRLLSDNLGGDDAKSKKSIAGLANRFRNASMQGVDANAMLEDLMKLIAKNPAVANAVFGSKQGGRIANALAEPEYLKHVLDEIKNHSEGYAKKVSDERMAGFDGAASRLSGSITNLESKMGQAWDDDGKGGFLTGLTNAAARATQALADMPNSVLQATSALLWLGGKAASVAGTVALVGAAFSLKGSAAALTAAAGSLALGGKVGAGGAAAQAASQRMIAGMGGGAGEPAAGVAGTAGAVAAGAVVAGVAVGGAVASAIANEAIKNKDFAEPYLDGGMLGADPGGYGLGAAIMAAPDLARRMGEQNQREAAARDTRRAAAASFGPSGGQAGSAARVMPGEGNPGGSSFGVGAKVLPGTVTPRVETGSLDAVKPKADEAKAALQQIGTVSVSPQVSTSSLDALIAKGHEALSVLKQIQGAAAAAGTAAVNGIRARGSSASFQGPDYAGP